MVGWCGFMCVAVFGMLIGVSIAEAAGDSASVTFQQGDKRVALQCVFAVMQADRGAEGEKNRVMVLLSDRPVPDEFRQASSRWLFWAGNQARAGALRGVILEIDPATGIWSGGQLLTNKGLMFYSESASSPEGRSLVFALAGPIGAQVAGKISMTETMSSFDDDIPRWRAEGEFRSGVIQRPAVTAVLTGPAAQNSPQYKAFLVHQDACRKKDLDAIRSSTSDASFHDLEAGFGGDKAAMIEMLAGMAAEAATLKLKKITVRGDLAEFELAGPDGTVFSSMVLSGGQWKAGE